MDIKVSVIIPCYNVERFLQDCIDSLLAQTLGDIEFIFVNDASPDNSLDILLKNQNKYPDKIRLIDLKHNICQGGARNKGIEIARGEYIGFVDSDDMVLPEMYEMLYNKAVFSKADAVFIKYANIGENFLFRNISTSKDFKVADKWNGILLYLKEKELDDDDRKALIINELGGVWAGLWRKDIIINNGLFFPEKLRYEDNFWNTLIRCYLNKISFVEEIGYLYRLNQQSTVRKRNQPYQYDRLKVERMLLDEVKKRGLFYRYQDVWEAIYIYRKTFNSIAMFTRKFDQPNCDIVRVLIKELKEEFPVWYKNKLWRKTKSKTAYIRCRFIAEFTELYIVMIKIKSIIKNFLLGR